MAAMPKTFPAPASPPAWGRAVLLAGAVVALGSGLLTWFWGGRPGEVTHEIGLRGEESLAALLSALAGGVAGSIAAVRRSRSAVLAGIGLAGGVACAALAGLYIDQNDDPLIVFGERIPTGIGMGAYVGLAGGVLMALGGAVDLWTRRRAVRP